MGGCSVSNRILLICSVGDGVFQTESSWFVLWVLVFFFFFSTKESEEIFVFFTSLTLYHITPSLICIP